MMRDMMMLWKAMIMTGIATARDSEYADGVDDALDEREEYGRDDW